jgi:hypothetical protein
MGPIENFFKQCVSLRGHTEQQHNSGWTNFHSEERQVADSFHCCMFVVGGTGGASHTGSASHPGGVPVLRLCVLIGIG